MRGLCEYTGQYHLRSENYRTTGSKDRLRVVAKLKTGQMENIRGEDLRGFPVTAPFARATVSGLSQNYDSMNVTSFRRETRKYALPARYKNDGDILMLM